MDEWWDEWLDGLMDRRTNRLLLSSFIDDWLIEKIDERRNG